MVNGIAVQDCFLILALHVKNIATPEEVELMLSYVTPLNDAINARLKPDNATVN